MTTRVPLGWDVFNATSSVPTGGHLLMTAGGTSGFMWNSSAGYPNWGYKQATVTANEKLARDAITWLCHGKATGQNILRIRSNTLDTSWGSFFKDFVERAPGDSGSQVYGTAPNGPYGPWNYTGGLSATLEQSIIFNNGNDWTDTNWSGVNPFDYDCVLLPSGWRSSNQALNVNKKLDYYLANNGSIWTYHMWGETNPTAWAPYGHGVADWPYPPTTALDGPAPDYVTPAVYVTPFKDYESYCVYTSRQFDPGESPNTMGGHAITYQNTFFLWWR